LEVKNPNLFKLEDDVGKSTNRYKSNLDRKSQVGSAAAFKWEF